MSSIDQGIARPAVAAALLTLAVVYVGSLPESFQQAPYIGIARLALAALAVLVSPVLMRTDKDYPWAIGYAVGAISATANLTYRAIGMPLIHNHMGPWGTFGNAVQLVAGLFLIVVAGWACVRRYGPGPTAAVGAYYVVSATHLGMLTVGLKAGALIGITQMLISMCCLIGAPILLIGNIGAWAFTLALGVVNTGGHLLVGFTRPRTMPDDPGLWWQVVSLVNLAAGVVLTVLAAHWLVRGFRQRSSAEGGELPGGPGPPRIAPSAAQYHRRGVPPPRGRSRARPRGISRP